MERARALLPCFCLEGRMTICRLTWLALLAVFWIALEWLRENRTEGSRNSFGFPANSCRLSKSLQSFSKAGFPTVDAAPVASTGGLLRE